MLDVLGESFGVVPAERVLRQLDVLPLSLLVVLSEVASVAELIRPVVLETVCARLCREELFQNLQCHWPSVTLKIKDRHILSVSDAQKERTFRVRPLISHAITSSSEPEVSAIFGKVHSYRSEFDDTMVTFLRSPSSAALSSASPCLLSDSLRVSRKLILKSAESSMENSEDEGDGATASVTSRATERNIVAILVVNYARKFIRVAQVIVGKHNLGDHH